MRKDGSFKPRIGLPYRTRNEELSGEFGKLNSYISALRSTGSEPVIISLGLSSDHLDKIGATLQGVLLPGSPADVDPRRFRAARNSRTADPDPDRERTDCFLVQHCFAEHKPVLAICYGIQMLNVLLGGTLVQDIPTELNSAVVHQTTGPGVPDVFHAAAVEPHSQLAQMASEAETIRVNSSHHQSIRAAGSGLRITARAPDGVIEAVELTSDRDWVVGVQWHPERMAEVDSVAQSLFRGLAEAACGVPADNPR